MTSSPELPTLRVGTRGSPLALAQAEFVVAQLGNRNVDARIVMVSTKGDRDAHSLSAMGEMGVFTKELQYQLITGGIDLAVHSLKDLPTDTDARLTLTAVPERRSAADVLISRHRGGLDGLPPAGRVGTGSPRRRAQLLALRPDLVVVPLRGNVETRMEFVMQEKLDGVVLAEAGLQRLGRTDKIAYRFDPMVFLPAPGQGALGIETRSDDETTQAAVRPLIDPPSMVAVLAERACLHALHAGCLAPVGAWARPIADNSFRLDAAVVQVDGNTRVHASVVWEVQNDLNRDVERGVLAGIDASEQLLRNGADELMRSARHQG